MKRKAPEQTSTYFNSHEDLSDISDIEDVYGNRVAHIQNQLEQLKNRTHPDYVSIREEVEAWYEEQKQRIQILHEHKIDTIYSEYTKESEACKRDCEHEKKRIQAYLVSLCEELKRRLEHDKKNIELTPSGDILELKPAVTRKLRRRGGNDLSSASSNVTNFLYWGDLLLCGSTQWQMNTSDVNSITTTITSTPVTSTTNVCHITTSSDKTLPSSERLLPGSDLVQGRLFSDGETDTTTREPSINLQGGFKNVITKLLDPHNNPNTSISTSATTVLTSNTTPLMNLNKTNLFGSLGVNLFDGSLLSHLLASINCTNVGTNNLSTLSGLILPLNFVQRGNLVTPSNTTSGQLSSIVNTCGMTNSAAAAAAAAAIAAGLIIPSSNGLPNTTNLNSTLTSLIQTQQHGGTTRKRRQPNSVPNAQLNLLLPEHDIYADLTIIHRACAKAQNSISGTGSGSNPSNRKHSISSGLLSPIPVGHSPNLPNTTQDDSVQSYRLSQATRDSGQTLLGSLGSPNLNEFGCTRGSTNRSTTGLSNTNCTSSFSAWIDDGRLYYGQKCYQVGTCVILEGRDGVNQKCCGTIVSIGAQDIAIRRSSDHGICRVTVHQLKQGRYALWLNGKAD